MPVPPLPPCPVFTLVTPTAVLACSSTTPFVLFNMEHLSIASSARRPDDISLAPLAALLMALSSRGIWLSLLSHYLLQRIEPASKQAREPTSSRTPLWTSLSIRPISRHTAPPTQQPFVALNSRLKTPCLSYAFVRLLSLRPLAPFPSILRRPAAAASLNVVEPLSNPMSLLLPVMTSSNPLRITTTSVSQREVYNMRAVLHHSRPAIATIMLGWYPATDSKTKAKASS